MEKMSVQMDVKSMKEREFEGLGAVFGNRDLGGDIIMPGAFAKTLREPMGGIKVRPMLWMHKTDEVIGVWDSMTESKVGLEVKGRFAPTERGPEVYTLAKMGAIGGMSIGYQVNDYAYDRKGNRLLKEVELLEVSVVSMPMNPLAEIAYVKTRMSANGEYVPTIKEFENILRDAGCSRAVAKQIAYKVRLLEDDGDSGDRSEEPPRQVGDDEEEKAAQALAEKIMADLIRQKFAA